MTQLKDEAGVAECDFGSVCEVGDFDFFEVVGEDKGSVRGAEVVYFPDAIFAGDFGVLAADVDTFGKRT